MDKETAVAIEKLKAAQEADGLILKEVRETQEAWEKFLRGAIIKVVKFLSGVGLMGVMIGHQLPENVRKNISEFMTWVSK